MLRDFWRDFQWYQEMFGAVQYWPELEFDLEARVKLESLKDVEKVNRSSLQIKTGKNICCIPSQYILYAIRMKPLIYEIKAHMDFFDAFREGFNRNQVGDKLDNFDFSSLAFDKLDDYSKTIAGKPFIDSGCRFNAKSILNGNTGNWSIRSTEDFFGSVILKIMNIPDASSAIIGSLIYNLANDIHLYSYLERKYISKLPTILKEKKSNVFAKRVIEFLWQYDFKNRWLDYEKPNPSATVNISIKYEDKSLTTIFKTADHPLEPNDLMQGNEVRFFEQPVFIKSGKYYYCSKEWYNTGIQRLDIQSLKAIVEAIYPELTIVVDNDVFHLNHVHCTTTENVVQTSKGYNKIIAGCPGTGKSYKVDKLVADGRCIRTVFHPEYTYSDFIGTYRPICGTHKMDKILSASGAEIPKPVSYFDFVPGPFMLALKAALEDASQMVFLVVEEINRGDCAAIFGDMFQLLDRAIDGTGEYTVQLKPEVEHWLNSNDVGTALEIDGSGSRTLRLPANLTILATMNTSDQSLLPMDSAFKRRWLWEAVPLNLHEPVLKAAKLQDSGGREWQWLTVVELLNDIIIESGLYEDKRIGPWFLQVTDNQIKKKEFRNKLLFYLWHDVFRNDRGQCFAEGVSTFEEAQAAFDEKGIVGVFSLDVSEKLKATSTPESTTKKVQGTIGKP